MCTTELCFYQSTQFGAVLHVAFLLFSIRPVPIHFCSTLGTQVKMRPRVASFAGTSGGRVPYLLFFYGWRQYGLMYDQSAHLPNKTFSIEPRVLATWILADTAFVAREEMRSYEETE